MTVVGEILTKTETVLGRRRKPRWNQIHSGRDICRCKVLFGTDSEVSRKVVSDYALETLLLVLPEDLSLYSFTLGRPQNQLFRLWPHYPGGTREEWGVWRGTQPYLVPVSVSRSPSAYPPFHHLFVSIIGVTGGCSQNLVETSDLRNSRPWDRTTTQRCLRSRKGFIHVSFINNLFR